MNFSKLSLLFGVGLLLLTQCTQTPAPVTGGASKETGPSPSSGETAGMPAVADQCTDASDCAFTTIGLQGKDTCCNSFTVTAGTKAWVKEVDKYCKSVPEPDCSHIPLSKIQQPPRVGCVAGHCRTQ